MSANCCMDVDTSMHSIEEYYTCSMKFFTTVATIGKLNFDCAWVDMYTLG